MRDLDHGDNHGLPDEAFTEDEITTGMQYPAKSYSRYPRADIDDDHGLPDEAFTEVD